MATTCILEGIGSCTSELNQLKEVPMESPLVGVRGKEGEELNWKKGQRVKKQSQEAAINGSSLNVLS